MDVPNNHEYLKKQVYLPERGSYTLFVVPEFFEFGKNANSVTFWYRVILIFSWLFGDNWSLAFFGASTSVSALFVF
jgi:hypothetical protein